MTEYTDPTTVEPGSAGTATVRGVEGVRVLDDFARWAGESLSWEPYSKRLQAKGFAGAALLVDLIREKFAALPKPVPPKPEAPEGLGAVVKDKWGCLWVRWAWDVHTHEPWRQVNSDETARWDDIPAVEVLSEGIS